MDAFKVVWESGQMELKGRIEKKINSHIRCTKDEILFLRAGAKMGDHDSFWMIGLSYQDSCQKEINAQLESSREAEEIFWQAINKMHMRYRADNNPFDPLKSFRKYLQTTVTRLIIDRNKEEQHIADCSPDIVPVLPPGPSISRTFLRFIEMVCIDNKPHQIIAFGMTELIHDKKKDNQWLIKLFSEQKLGDLADQFIKSYLDQFYDVMIAEKDKVHDAFLPLIRNIESPAAKCYKDKEYKPIIKRIHKTKEILFREFYHDWPDQLITFGFVEILRTEPKEIVEKYINESFEALTNAYLIERGPDFLTVMGYDALANLILRMKWRTEECYPKNKDLQEKHDRVGEIKFSEFFINTSEAERKNSIDETIKDLQKLTHKAKGQASADIALWKRRLKERAIKYFEGRI